MVQLAAEAYPYDLDKYIPDQELGLSGRLQQLYAYLQQ